MGTSNVKVKSVTGIFFKKANRLPERARATLKVRNTPELLLFIWSPRCALSSVISSTCQSKEQSPCPKEFAI